MLIMKYICAIIALFTTLLYISDIIVSFTSEKFWLPVDGEAEPAMKHAAMRLILGAIMAVTWPVLFIF